MECSICKKKLSFFGEYAGIMKPTKYSWVVVILEYVCVDCYKEHINILIEKDSPIVK
jgi:hypothetical protein